MNKKEPFIWDLETAKREHQHSPALAEVLANILPKEIPVVDFGCGKGTYLKHLSDRGFDCQGIEGTKGIEEIADFDNIWQGDLSTPGILCRGTNNTWYANQSLNGYNAICLEVAEHIAKEDESVFLDNITAGCHDWLILSWAVPGQGGCGHHNEQPPEYVIETMKQRGFDLQYTESKLLRAIAGADLWWFKKSLYVFRKKNEGWRQ